MSDSFADTRTTIYVKEVFAMAEALDLPKDTDPTKVMRIARERLTHLGVAKPVSIEEWMRQGYKFFTNERA
jgi:hypothetical protein